MTDPKHTLLIVEDDLDVADMLNAYFRSQGYDVMTVNWGEDALRISAASLPDLIILDIRLPDIDGFEVAQRLRSNRRTKDVPIIFLTEKRGRKDRLHGLELGADDYITKPFDVHELRLRIRNSLRRSSPSSLTNPITNLPEGPLLEEQLCQVLASPGWGVLAVTILHLDHFRETYGFVASDDVLRAASLILQNVLRENTHPLNYLGQPAPASLLLVTSADNLPLVAEQVRARLESSLDYFYPLRDLDVALVEPGKGEQRLSFEYQQLGASEGALSGYDQLRKKLKFV